MPADEEKRTDGPGDDAVDEGLEDADEEDVDPDVVEGPDAEELEDEEVLLDEDEADGAEAAAEDEDEDDADPSGATTRTKRRAGEEEEDEDEELLSPDDVEADLDRILKDRLVTAEDEDDDEDEEPEDRAEGGDRLQPKRADEQLCPTCFLLVRATAPTCPVGDDDCPIFG